MNLTNNYYYFTRAIDRKTCNKILKVGGKEEEAVVGHGGQATKIDKKVRISKVAWTSDQWVYDLIWPYMLEANDLAGWRYDITGAEGTQIGKYEEGGFYGFHMDGKSDNFSVYNTPENKFKHGNVRKLSLSLLLNDDYEGGDFQFAKANEEVHTPDFNKLGSIIVFPSFMMHRVEPVTKGTRYSLVSWFLGPPFR